MIILFAPSEGKRCGGEMGPLDPKGLVFPELYPQRLEAIERYESLIRTGTDEQLSELFGIKDPKEFGRYQCPLAEAPTMKAIERYDGVAYDYLRYPKLSSEAQAYIDTRTFVFSNLFGPLRASDAIPDYKLKQGASIEAFIPDRHYKSHFSAALDAAIGDEEILDLRAGYYDKFYVPNNRVVTLKFLKEGKVVSHWAKAYRGIVLREAASHRIESVEGLLALDIPGLMLHEIIETKKKKEIVYAIV